MSKSFLPSTKDANPSRLKMHDESLIKPSRNLSKDLFQPSMPSKFANSRLTSHTKSAVKAGHSYLKRLKTPDLRDLKLDSNSQVLESPEREFSFLSAPLIYRNAEFRFEDVYVMLNVMIKKCNDVISTSKIFKDNNLLTKKIFEDCVEYILSRGYSTGVRVLEQNTGSFSNERMTVEGVHI